MHSPVDNIKAIGRNLTARAIHCCDGIIFLSSENGPTKVIQFTEGAIDILSKAKRKGDLIKVARQLNLSTEGIVQELKNRLQRYHTSLKAKYEQKNIQLDEVHFWNSQTQPSFESMLCHDEDVIYAARNDTKVIASFQVEKDRRWSGRRKLARIHEVWQLMEKDLQHVSV